MICPSCEEESKWPYACSECHKLFDDKESTGNSHGHMGGGR